MDAFSHSVETAFFVAVPFVVLGFILSWLDQGDPAAHDGVRRHASARRSTTTRDRPRTGMRLTIRPRRRRWPAPAGRACSACSIRSSTGGSGCDRLGFALPYGDLIDAVQQRLATKPLTDRARFDDERCRLRLVLDRGQVLGVVEQAVREMVGARSLSQGGDGRVERAPTSALTSDIEAGAGEQTFGTQQRREMSDRVGVQQCQEVGDRLIVAEIVSTPAPPKATPKRGSRGRCPGRKPEQ